MIASALSEIDDILVDQSIPNPDTLHLKHHQRRPWWKTLLKYMFSHIGLCFLVAVYCVVGTLLFMALEGPNEDTKLTNRRKAALEIEDMRTNLTAIVKSWKKDAQSYMTGGAAKNATAAYQNYLDAASAALQEYHDAIAAAIGDYGYQGFVDEEDALPKQWSFPSVLLLMVTIVTSIGYGHITPKTPFGRMMIIPYALIGIPLCLMFLANVGEVLAGCIRTAYARGCCYFLTRRRAQNAHRPPADNMELFASQDYDEGFAEDTDSAMHSTRTMVHTPHMGLPIGMMSPNLVEHIIIDKSPDPVIQIPVPISMTAFLLISYVMIGSTIFWAWEGWTFTQAAYFCFITLATIGFGDLVPGWNSITTLSGQFKLAVSSFYIMFGLAFLSMGFNLMIDEMLDRFRAVGLRAKLIKEEEDEGVPKQKCNLEDMVKRQIAKP